ncbi:protein FAM222B [Oryzias latipes]|uniref:Family with sequence similarity 222 member Bb n=1 Tax=Oryzias latipes TaxID=8090 RepID=H2L995_ORYLA|nr:protein FAM222B [Oryzias latipes]
MLACLPASGDPTIRLLPHAQMNTGLQRWETTQKMRSASYPTPAQLDAYAKKVANNPLTIQIFPNSVKVPQRKHIRRTVNGLDTSSSGQRHSPYPSQISASGGLLAVLRAPVKGIIKEAGGIRNRHHKAVMNPQTGPYASQSTLNPPHPAVSQLPGPPQPSGQKQGMLHAQALQQQQILSHSRALQQQQQHHPQALQQRNMTHSQALQQQQQGLSQVQVTHQQKLSHQQGIQRQQSLPHSQALQQQDPSCPSVMPQKHLSHVQTMKHQTIPPQALLTQQGVTQDLRLISDGAQLPSMRHSQGLAASQALPQAVAVAPPTISNSLHHPQQGHYAPRKLPDADAPPNVTVSTSTIPLSMAASLHQNRPSDLSSIVHQINQLCQARAGLGTTSVCEGQIANPSPISRNLLINASSRVSSHHPSLSNAPSCHLVTHPDKAPAPTTSAALHSQPSLAANNSMTAFHGDNEKVQLQIQQHLQQQQQQQHLQQLQQQQRSWAQHQLAHMQQPPEGVHPCKNPRMEPPAECAFPSRNLSYSHKLPNTGQSFPLKHHREKPPPSPVSCSLASMPYTNGQYMQAPWNSIPTTTGSNGSCPQDVSVFLGGQNASSADRIPGAKYRPGADAAPGQAKLKQRADFLGGDFQMPGFQGQNMDVIEKLHRSSMSQVQETSNSGGVPIHHSGYR